MKYAMNWMKAPLALALLVALLLSSRPASAQITLNCSGLSGVANLDCKLLQQENGSTTNNSGNPSGSSGKTVTIAAVAAGAAVGLLVFYIVKKRRSRPAPGVQPFSPPSNFNSFFPSQPAKQSFPMTTFFNLVTAEAVPAQGRSKALAFSDWRPGPFSLSSVRLLGNFAAQRTRDPRLSPPKFLP